MVFTRFIVSNFYCCLLSKMDRHFVMATIVWLQFACQAPLGRSCPVQVQQGIGIEKIHLILDEAKERSNDNGTILLNGYGRPPTADGLSTGEWPPLTRIFRAPEGGTVLIPCDNRHNKNNTQVSHVNIPPAFTYNGVQHSVPTANKLTDGPGEYYCCNCAKKYDPQNLYIWCSITVPEYDLITGEFSIRLINFSHIHVGLYECLHSNGSHLVVTQRYWVSPQLFRNQVFTPPMNNISVRLGEPAEMVCMVRFHALPGLLSDRFLWRKGRHLLFAQSVKDFASRVTQWKNFHGYFQVGSNDYCSCNSTMIIARVGWEHAGRYECWFRINDHLDEWVVQEAYLHVA